MKEKQALADVTGPRYRKAHKAGKSIILDEFCQSIGYHRKHAITLLSHAGKTQLRRTGKETVKEQNRPVLKLQLAIIYPANKRDAQ